MCSSSDHKRKQPMSEPPVETDEKRPRMLTSTTEAASSSEAGPSRLTRASTSSPPPPPPPLDHQGKAIDVTEDHAAAQGAELDASSAPMLGFSIKYQRSVLSARLAEDETVADLKAILFSMTDVPPESQKLLGMVKGKPPADETLLGTIPYAPAALRARPAPTSTKQTGKETETTTDTAAAAELACKLTVQFTLLGTPEAGRFKDQAAEAASALSSDQAEGVKDLDYLELPESATAKLKPHEDPKNRARLEKVIRRFSDFPTMHAPRPGKKLLVLDLDYCIADTKRLLDANSPASLGARPGLHELLTAAYPHYDICVWSQTSWRWLEVKLIELNMLNHPDYCISFVVDRTPMFKIHSKAGSHEVKALEFIWRRWPTLYGPHNTIHIDDLSRNFAMNPRNGLKIKPYRNAPTFDTEFIALRRYLLQLAHPSVTDFTQHEHSAWKHFQGPQV